VETVNKIGRGGKRALATLLLLFAVSQGAAHAQSSVSDETRIRAAMLINLTKFIDWPAAKVSDAQKPFVIGYIGDEWVGRALNNLLSGKHAQGKSVVVQNISTPAQAAQCHILYVANSGRKQYKEMAPALYRAAVLIVSERQLGDSGIVIGLPLVDDNIQIQVDLKMAQSSGLTISSRLLHIAAVTR
jgi:phosphohistidine swiveling domain-containing protein